MEFILIGIIILLLVVCIYLALQKAKAVSKSEFDKLSQYKQELEIEYAKVKQCAEWQAQEKEELRRLRERAQNERNALGRPLEGTNAYLEAQQEEFEGQKEER